MSIARLYISGTVRRYHANPDMAHLGQTNADHQGRCVQLALALHPHPTVALLDALANHDVGELDVCDLSGPFKGAHPALAADHAEIEAGFLRNTLGRDVLRGLHTGDLWWLSFIDKLEAYAFMLSHAPSERGLHGWPEARAKLLDLAGVVCGLQDRVAGLFWDLEARAW